MKTLKNLFGILFALGTFIVIILFYLCSFALPFVLIWALLHYVGVL